MRPWELIETAAAPDGEPLELRRRDGEYLITAGGYDLMSLARVYSSNQRVFAALNDSLQLAVRDIGRVG